MRNLFLFFGLLCASLATAQAPAGYYPLKITNKAGGTSNVKATYLIMTGQMWNSQATNCVLQLTWSKSNCGYLAQLVPVTMQTNPAKFSYRLDTLQQCVGAGDTVTIYLPQLQSGRAMVSFNYMMQMPPVTAANGTVSLQEPNINNPQDANNGILFDKFEFSYDQKNTMYIDLTAVDFFAIPMGLSLNGQRSGVTKATTRTALLNTMQKTLKTYDKSPNGVWSKLTMKSSDGKTILRLASPYLAPNFDLTYLSNKKTYGINYIDTLCMYYARNQYKLVIDCSELNDTSFEVFDYYLETPAQDPGAYFFTGTMSADGKTWTFINNPTSTKGPLTRTINMGQANSYDFFAPGISPFDTPDKTIKSIIVRQISSAFTVGLLPVPNGDTLNPAYLAPSTFYPAKSVLPGTSTAKGPWYNLYTRAVHSAIPQIYAFAFDDQLGQSGTLTSTNAAFPAIITIHSMAGTNIPGYKYYPALQPVAISSFTTFTANAGSKTYTATINWTAPAGQPSNAEYYFLTYGGSGCSVASDTLIYKQVLKSPGNLKGTYSMTLPASAFPNNNPSGATLQILSCGGSYACPTSSNVFMPGGPAVQPGLTPFAATNVSWTTFSANTSTSGDTLSWTTSISWKSPANQVPGVSYYWMLTSANFLNVDSLIKIQLPGYSVSNDSTTTVSVTLPASWFTNKTPQAATQLQILTCGGTISCPTSASLFSPAGPGTAPVSPSVSAPRLPKPKPGSPVKN